MQFSFHTTESICPERRIKMQKKIISFLLCLCLFFSISAMAENETTGDTNTSPAQTPAERGNRPPGFSGNMPEGMTPPSMQDGERPQWGSGEFTPPDGFTPPENTENISSEEATQNESSAETNTEEQPQNQNGAPESNNWGPPGNMQFDGRMPGERGGFPGNMQNQQQPEEEKPKGFSGFVKTYSTPIASGILLLFAFIFVIFYKRKRY